MHHLVYPRKTQKLFTNRVTELEILESYQDRLLHGEPNKLALLGTRRIGKSTVLYEFIKRHAANKRLLFVYVNLQRLVMEPLAFAKSYVGLATKWALRDETENFASYEDPEFCMLQLQKRQAKAAEYLYQFLKSAQSRSASLKSLLEQALHFPMVLAEGLKKPIVVMIDEFQEITLLNNFKQLPEILGLLRDVLQTHHRILYVFAGSYIRLMQNIIEKPSSPFFGQIQPYYLSAFGKEDALVLLKKIAQQIQLEAPKEVEKKMVALTAGHPLYIEALVRAAQEAVMLDGITLNEETVQRVLLLQLVNERSPLSFHLRYIYEDALGRARGSTILRGILKALAQDTPLTITAIAQKMSKQVGLIQAGIAELLKVDLVDRKDKLYFISDPLLRWWMYFKFFHPEGAFSLKDEIVQELASHFREKYLQVATELGRTKEFELHYFVMRKQGAKVGNIRLPIFKTVIKNYLLPNGEEIDLFARNDEAWVFELKWKNKLVGMNELHSLKEKIKVQRYVLISKKGFTPELLAFARKSPEVVLWGAEVLTET
ncbi:MAG: ATP-binding protein [candidate division KSB1 bacterium]